MGDRGLGLGLGRMFRGGLKSHGGLFLTGLALGPIAFKILTSDDAKRVYTNLIAAGLRAKEYTMDTVASAQECIEDMVAEAEFINDMRQSDYFDEFYDEDEDYYCFDEDCEDEGCNCKAGTSDFEEAKEN